MARLVLEKHFRTAQEIWLLYYKKHSGKPRLTYEDAVQEALCFGWSDGKTKKFDEERYVQRFSPRNPTSRWSALNTKRVRKLIREQQMTPYGLAVFHPERRVPRPVSQFSPDLEKKFRQQKGAWNNFQIFPPYYRRMTIA